MITSKKLEKGRKIVSKFNILYSENHSILNTFIKNYMSHDRNLQKKILQPLRQEYTKL